MSAPSQSRLQRVQVRRTLHASPTRARRQRGFSLLEMVGVVALIGMLLSLCAATLNRAYQVHHAALDSFQELEQLNFWCERFRVDAHQALAYELRPEGPAAQALTLLHAQDRSITYSTVDGQLVRSLDQAGQRLAREVLATAPPAEIYWTVDPSGRIPLLGCHIAFEDASSERQPLTWWSRLHCCRGAKED